MRFEMYSWKDIEDQYPQLYAEVFGHLPPIADAPAVCALGYENLEGREQYCGFVSGFLHDKKTFYIKAVGLVPHLRSRARAYRFWMETAEFFREQGMHLLLGLVENTNTPALLVALKSGWKVCGCRVDRAGNLFVEIRLGLK